jgi:AcrR family transcriptional regulator
MGEKGRLTRQRIAQSSAALFNVSGYMATAMSDIIEAAGIQKGGIYRHFESKDDIMLAAFQYAAEMNISAVLRAIAPHPHAADQLMALSRTFLDMAERPVLPGGCPYFNAAVEMDDSAHPLREYVQQALQQLSSLIGQIVAEGKQRGELQPFVNGEVVATLIIAACEGGLVLSRLYNDTIHLHRVLDHLAAYFETLCQRPAIP